MVAESYRARVAPYVARLAHPFLGWRPDRLSWVALGLAAVAAVAGGGIVARLTGRAFWRGALRQLLLGACAAGITYLIGIVVGHVAS